jgi:hypothetical protein
VVLYNFSVNFSSPLFIYQDKATPKVGFYGTWTITTISVAQGTIGAKSDKSNVLMYKITTDGTMSTVTEKVNGTTVATKSVGNGVFTTCGLTQAQWDVIKFGKYADTTAVLNTLTISMGIDSWTYTFDKRLATTDDILSATKASQDVQTTFIPAQLARLKAVAESKGATVPTNPKFDDIMSAIASISAKKQLSGTGISSAATTAFVNSGGSATNAYTLTVTGLTFKPSIISVFRTSDGFLKSTLNTKSPLNAGFNLISVGTSAIRLTGNAVINDTSFTIPVDTTFASENITWFISE